MSKKITLLILAFVWVGCAGNSSHQRKQSLLNHGYGASLFNPNAQSGAVLMLTDQPAQSYGYQGNESSNQRGSSYPGNTKSSSGRNSIISSHSGPGILSRFQIIDQRVSRMMGPDGGSNAYNFASPTPQLLGNGLKIMGVNEESRIAFLPNLLVVTLTELDQVLTIPLSARSERFLEPQQPERVGPHPTKIATYIGQTISRFLVVTNDGVALGSVAGFDPVTGAPIARIDIQSSPYAFGRITDAAFLDEGRYLLSTQNGSTGQIYLCYLEGYYQRKTHMDSFSEYSSPTNCTLQRSVSTPAVKDLAVSPFGIFYSSRQGLARLLFNPEGYGANFDLYMMNAARPILVSEEFKHVKVLGTSGAVAVIDQAGRIRTYPGDNSAQWQNQYYYESVLSAQGRPFSRLAYTNGLNQEGILAAVGPGQICTMRVLKTPGAPLCNPLGFVPVDVAINPFIPSNQSIDQTPSLASSKEGSDSEPEEKE